LKSAFHPIAKNFLKEKALNDIDLARRLLLAHGACRFIIFGVMPEITRTLLRDAGSEVLEQGATPKGGPRPAWLPEFLARSCLVCLNLSDSDLTSVLSTECFAHSQGIYIQQPASEALASVESIEQRAFALGYRKHPAYFRLFGYADLENTSGDLATLLEPVPIAALQRFPMSLLLQERDLHMDMMREAGRRSDAHIVRYDWASKFIRPNDVVLDAACGLGYGTHVMRHLSEASRLHAIDGSTWAIDYANTSFGRDNVEYTGGFLPDALSRFEDASIDLIVSFETLEHVSDPTRLLEAFHRVLRPGGRIIVSIPNDWSDETGEDPNPHHLHVYTYERLTRELASGFTIEHTARQIASGCKLVDSHCQWVARPRALDIVDSTVAPHTEAEWWLAVAMKSPETGRAIAYHESVHGHFEGRSHLIDFAKHYTNPWLVHAMIEIPFRVKSTQELGHLARQVCANYPIGTADHGAALTILCYRALEENANDEHLENLERGIADFVALATTNPHMQRWHISLIYVRARLRLRRGDRDRALEDFSKVAKASVADITPTLGTKVIDAAFWAGTLSWSNDEKDSARRWWRLGLLAAGHLVGSAWAEFFGNIEAPFLFAMNDAIEIVDRATACARALSITHQRSDATQAALYDISQQSLRSALRQRDADILAAHAEVSHLRREFVRVCGELQAHDVQKMSIESVSLERLHHAHALESQLDRTQVALNEAQSIALGRIDQIRVLEERLGEFDAALSDVKAQSLHRLDEKMTLEKRIELTDAIALDRMARIQALDARLLDTDAALDAAKAQCAQYLEEKIALEKRVKMTDAIAHDHMDRIQVLDARLRDTDAALNASKAQCLQGLEEKMALEDRVKMTDAALEEVKKLAINRLCRIEELEQHLRSAQATSEAIAATTTAIPNLASSSDHPCHIEEIEQ
jgi:SAM-dependent methyltransferase